MRKISEGSTIKMKDYISARNNSERLGMVEVVAQYLMDDLKEIPEENREEALLMTRYHLSTDRGIEDLKVLYTDALAWSDEGLFKKGLETK